MSTQQILKEALALPPKQKARLAEELLASLDDSASREIDQAWGEEAEGRIDAFAKGDEQADTVESVVKALRRRKR